MSTIITVEPPPPSSLPSSDPSTRPSDVVIPPPHSSSSLHPSSTPLRRPPRLNGASPQPEFPLGEPTPPLSPLDDLFYEHPDPLDLARMKKSKDEIEKIKRRKIRRFYRDQNSLIDELLTLPGVEDEEKERRNEIKIKIAIYGSFAANIALFSLQLTAAIVSGSLSLFATMADSFMDLLSGFILLYAARAAGQKNLYTYPTGKARMETVGVIIFATLMATLSLELIIEAVRTLISGENSPNIGAYSIAFVSIALGAKLLLFLYCRLLDDPAAQALAQDHRNDLIINAFGLTLGILGSKVNHLIDPIGAILVALIILQSWSRTAYAQMKLIVGSTADPFFLQRVTYIALTHHPWITKVDTCRAYHAGSKLFVEVDIVMHPETILRDSHDIGESLQTKLESLPRVERAFVHVDFEYAHKPEHPV